MLAEAVGIGLAALPLAGWGWMAFTGRLSLTSSIPTNIIANQRAAAALPPLPPRAALKVEPWSRDDARKAAAMYREVPSAFWLAPEFTAYDGPEEAVAPRKASAYSRQEMVLKRLTRPGMVTMFEDKPIIGGWYDPITMLYKLQLEGGEWVNLTHQMIEDWERHKARTQAELYI